VGGAITGTVAVSVFSEFTWRGGRIGGFNNGAYGTISAMENCHSTWQLPAQGPSVIEDFIFTNLGTLDWTSGDLRIATHGSNNLIGNAAIFNIGQFNVTNANEISLTSQILQPALQNPMSISRLFVNNVEGTVSIQGGTFSLNNVEFANDGRIEVNNANLKFREENEQWKNTGIFDADANSTVTFARGNYIFEVDQDWLQEVDYELGGDGQYVFRDGGSLVVPQNELLWVCNLQLLAGFDGGPNNFQLPSNVAGAGDLGVRNLRWFGAGVPLDGGAGLSATMTGAGNTIIEESGTLSITGADATLRQRTLTIKGSANWEGTQLRLFQTPQIIIDGGSFAVTSTTDSRIFEADEEDVARGSITIRNNGLFRKDLPEAPLVTRIDVLFTNNNSRVEIDGVVQWNSGANFTQLGENAISVFGSQTYSLFNATLTGGTIELNGGTLFLPDPNVVQPVLVGLTFRLSGTVNHFWAVNSSIFLIGDLLIDSPVVFSVSTNDTLSLQGYRLTLTRLNIANASLGVFLGGGSIVTTDPFDVEANRPKLFGEGYINGVYYTSD